jgi:hypothetical protein
MIQCIFKLGKLETDWTNTAPDLLDQLPEERMYISDLGTIVTEIDYSIYTVNENIHKHVQDATITEIENINLHTSDFRFETALAVYFEGLSALSDTLSVNWVRPT